MAASLWAVSGLAPMSIAPGFSAVVDRLNARFAAGRASSNLTAAGVLIHQFDDTEGGDDAMDERWLPCPATCYNHSCWCAPFRDRWSTSVVNAASPRTGLDELILFSKRAGGLVFSPSNTVLCSYAQDGATESRICDPVGPHADCVPGCYTEATNGHPCWCDEVAPAQSCAHPNPQNLSSPCAWKPAALGTMMQRQHAVGSYNEVVIDAAAYAHALPWSLEAVFFLATDECATAKECEPLARSVHAAYVAAHNSSAAPLPLLRLNVSEPRAPFAAVERVDTVEK